MILEIGNWLKVCRVCGVKQEKENHRHIPSQMSGTSEQAHDRIRGQHFLARYVQNWCMSNFALSHHSPFSTLDWDCKAKGRPLIKLYNIVIVAWLKISAWKKTGQKHKRQFHGSAQFWLIDRRRLMYKEKLVAKVMFVNARLVSTMKGMPVLINM